MWCHAHTLACLHHVVTIYCLCVLYVSDFVSLPPKVALQHLIIVLSLSIPRSLFHSALMMLTRIRVYADKYV